ncbi:restriction endonuclease subunit S [uncultured Winogradskyella sp.]|uniref:restriction endonuclease subunit S n=1 Tax=uncultured Winogradskyella sp. TaxID=395353 RepID=UPI0030ECBD78|tara:strand:- start:2279 stop:3568 length:1290 start_codon:yes stop_codon:yes gene_type:complete
MTNTTKHTKPLKPKLRFAAFEGEWEKKKFGDIAIKVGSGSTPRGGVEVYQNFGIPFIRSQNVVNDRLVLDETCISEEINSKMKGSIVKPKDILLNITGGSIGRSCIVPEDFTIGNVNQHVCIIRLNKNNSPKFIQSFISSYKGQKLITQGQTGSGREGLNFQSIRLFNTHIPKLAEQQKIANFLTAVDTKLQQLTTKKETLAQYKKGLMQQLFSQQLRFKPDVIASTQDDAISPNETGFPDWDKLQLSDLAERVKTKNKIDNQNVLTISAQLGLVSQLEYFNKSVSAKNLTGYYLLERNDFAYNKSYSNGYPMGAIKRLNKYDFGVVSTLYICFRFNKKVSLDFMEQYFEFGLQNREIEKVAQEGARNHGLLNIGVNDFFDIDMNIPSLKEQQKIATYLSAIDTKIEAVQTQISNTQAFKKGLLQQMFV